MMKLRSLVAIAVVLVSLGVGAANASPPTSVPKSTITVGPVTASLVSSYYSTAATELVVVLEMTSTEQLKVVVANSVYLGPDGQQVEATDRISPDDLFPGATSLVVLSFPAATPGGSIMFTALGEDTGSFDIALDVPD